MTMQAGPLLWYKERGERMTLTREEQETHFSQTAQDRIDGVWHIYTDDLVWIGKIDKLLERACSKGLEGTQCEKVESHGMMQYRLQSTALQAGLRLKRQVSEEDRARIAEQLRRGRDDKAAG